jgi:hypothetical protein
MNVHATVFNPLAEHEPYMVVASALPPGVHPLRTFPIRRAMAATLEEAVLKCCELASEVRRLSEQLGHRVQGMRCSHCPTRHAPLCGALAI